MSLTFQELKGTSVTFTDVAAAQLKHESCHVPQRTTNTLWFECVNVSGGRRMISGEKREETLSRVRSDANKFTLAQTREKKNAHPVLGFTAIHRRKHAEMWERIWFSTRRSRFWTYNKSIYSQSLKWISYFNISGWLLWFCSKVGFKSKSKATYRKWKQTWRQEAYSLITYTHTHTHTLISQVTNTGQNMVTSMSTEHEF